MVEPPLLPPGPLSPSLTKVTEYETWTAIRTKSDVSTVTTSETRLPTVRRKQVRSGLASVLGVPVESDMPQSDSS